MKGSLRRLLPGPFVSVALAMLFAWVPPGIMYALLRSHLRQSEFAAFGVVKRSALDECLHESAEIQTVIVNLRNALADAASAPEAFWTTASNGVEWRDRAPSILATGYAEVDTAGQFITIRRVDSRSPSSSLHPGEVIRGPALTEALNKVRGDHRHAIHAAQLQGVSGAIAMADLSVLRNSGRWQGVVFALVDDDWLFRVPVSAVRDGLLLLDHDPPRLPAVLNADHWLSHPVGVGMMDCLWRVNLIPGPAFLAQRGDETKLFTLGFVALGVVLSLVLAGLAWSLARSYQQALLAREQLADANATLERRVSERTVELSDALLREQEAGKLKTHLVNTVSHEFRTPLTIILSSAELLEAHGSQLERAQRESQWRAIQHATGHMDAMLDHVLALGRLESGAQACVRAPVNMPELMETLVDEAGAATQNRCQFDLTVADEARVLPVDEMLLRHGLLNVLMNAAKYSTEGSVVEAGLHLDQRALVVVIQDHGVGIPWEDQPRLFRAFQRGSNVAHLPGTGLGLAIARRSIELHGGSVQLSSTPGQGTRVEIRIPVA